MCPKEAKKTTFPIRDVPSEEELNTQEWELLLHFRKMKNYPDLQKILMDEANKLGNVARSKEQNIGMLLPEGMLQEGEKRQDQEAIELTELRKMLDRAKKEKRKK